MTEGEQALRDELDLANRKLAEAHKMASLGRLAAGIVHEINTPVGSILSNNEVVRRSLERLRQTLAAVPETPAKTLQILETLAGLVEVDKLACERISGVVRSLKTFARGDGERREADLNDILGATVKLASTVYRRRVAMVTEFGSLPPIECHPAMLGQVFLNLIVNAAQAIPDEGTVTVRSETDGPDWVRVSVADTGSGIRPEDRRKIFAPGFTTKPLGEGTGLGLTITREIVVDVHRGTIEFESQLGVGTTFHVRLPVRASIVDGGNR